MPTETRPYPLMCLVGRSRRKREFACYSDPEMRTRAYRRLILLAAHVRDHRVFIDPDPMEEA